MSVAILYYAIHAAGTEILSKVIFHKFLHIIDKTFKFCFPALINILFRNAFDYLQPLK